MTPDIRPVVFSEAAFAPILAEAEHAGGAFMLRVREEWVSGVHCFDGPGEFLLGAFLDGELVGVGGVSRDPYDPRPGLGRIRHIYVSQRLRGTGVGRALIAAIVERARAHWQVLRLRTKEAGAFYERLGFRRHDGPNETHRLDL
jgi:GNAT superfamily N-acetyltransferase